MVWSFNMSYIDEILNAVKSNDFDAALKMIEEHRAEHEHEPEFITVQVMLCLQAQEYDTALNLLHDGLKRHPGDVDLLYNVGHVYQAMGNLKQAIENYENVIKLTNDSTSITELNQLCTDIKASQEYKKQTESNNRLIEELKKGVFVELGCGDSKTKGFTGINRYD